MAQRPVTSALLEVLKILKKYVYFRDNSYYLVLSLYILFTYCFKQFDSLPYILITGPFGSGKTLIQQILKLLCYRALPATSISPAAFYHVIISGYKNGDIRCGYPYESPLELHLFTIEFDVTR